MSTLASPPATTRPTPGRGLQRTAAALCGVVGALYALSFADVLSIEGAAEDDRAILAVAAAVFAVLTVLLWVRRSRALWAAAAGLQVLLGGMYLAVAPDRDPSYEVWGVTIRLVSVALLVVLVALLVQSGRQPRPD